MQLTKGYFVISRLLHRLGRAQSYWGRGWKERKKVFRLQEGSQPQCPSRSTTSYCLLPTPNLHPCQKRPGLCTCKDELLISICHKDNIIPSICHRVTSASPVPSHSSIRYFLGISPVHNIILGAKMMPETSERIVMQATILR